jgi:branched-chain amino acid aminotransferase
VYPYESNNFELNAKGLEVDLYTDIKKQKNFLSNFKTKSGLVYVMAAINATDRKLDDVLIGNDRGGILESSSCNLFVVSNGVLYTPGLEEGCLAGTMRMQIINLAIANGIKVYECNILPQNLLAADEIFLTNAIRGINWVSGYRTKRYFNNMARRFVALLNDYWEEQLQDQ